MAGTKETRKKLWVVRDFNNYAGRDALCDYELHRNKPVVQKSPGGKFWTSKNGAIQSISNTNFAAMSGMDLKPGERAQMLITITHNN